MPSRRDNRVNTRGRNNSQQAEDVTEVGSNQPNNIKVLENARKRVRGPTFMPKLWTKTDEDCISDKFDMPGSDDWILKSFGRKVKNWRATVKKEYYDPTLPFHEQIIFKPKRVLASQWKRLVKYWNKGKSKKPTQSILISVIWFGVIRIWTEHELDEPGPQDIYSKVMGNDKNGTAEMYGLGVRSSDVWGMVPSCSARRRDKLQWKSTAERLSIELAEYKTREAQRQRSSDNNSDGTNVPQISPQGLIVSNEPQPL
uniref:Uncharacterized protein n=1 Tax=Tanacetum cinerariifolium TaxID=118510 RepID=A0A6L2MHF5_TANCI|nr:hypothetical protein [Tanacetum cinerariifolium]